MCTRFFIEPETEEFQEIIAQAQQSRPLKRLIQMGRPLFTSGEIRPSNH